MHEFIRVIHDYDTVPCRYTCRAFVWVNATHVLLEWNKRDKKKKIMFKSFKGLAQRRKKS